MADCTLRTHPYLISVKSEERRVKFPFVCAATFTRMSPAIFLCTLSAVVAQVSLCCRDYKGADSWKWWEQLGGITGWFAWTWQCHCVEPFPCFSLPSISPSSTYTWPIHHHWEWIKSMALSALPCKTFFEFWVRCSSCCILQICHYPPTRSHTDWILPSTVQPLTSADDMWELHCGEEQHHWRKLLGLTKWFKVLVERQTPCQSSDMTGTSKWQGSCLLRGMWQSGRQPEKDDDRQTACWCYQRLPICLRIPQDIGHGYVTAVYRVSG